jgi:uncharacterized MAPEG superfamily protein
MITSTPVWVLLGFAGWTVLLLLSTIGVYRWKRILTRKAEISEFRADEVRGEEWYRRAMRAHANCVENLPVYCAVVVAMLAGGGSSPLLDALSLSILPARVAQSLIHVTFQQTNRIAALRFAFFAVQLGTMIAMGTVLALRAVR